MIEEQLTGLPIQPNKVAVLDLNSLGISPNYFDTNSSANYTMVFKPLNFEQNMTVHIAVPASIGIPDKPVCRGLQGTDSTNLNCTRANRTITIHDAWLKMTERPETIALVMNNLTNPAANVLTKSFQLTSKTHDGYLIDERTSGLSINFYCSFPCRTCGLTRPTQCLSCYFATTEFKYLHKA